MFCFPPTTDSKLHFVWKSWRWPSLLKGGLQAAELAASAKWSQLQNCGSCTREEVTKTEVKVLLPQRHCQFWIVLIFIKTILILLLPYNSKQISESCKNLDNYLKEIRNRDVHCFLSGSQTSGFALASSQQNKTCTESSGMGSKGEGELPMKLQNLHRKNENIHAGICFKHCSIVI